MTVGTDAPLQLQGHIAGAAGDVERDITWAELGAVGGAVAPAMVHAGGHRRVHQVVDAGDPVEHSPDLAGELLGISCGLTFDHRNAAR